MSKHRCVGGLKDGGPIVVMFGIKHLSASNKKKIRLVKNLLNKKNIYSAKQLLAYYLGDEMFDKPWLHLKLAEKFACLNPKVMELAENLLPKIFNPSCV